VVVVVVVVRSNRTIATRQVKELDQKGASPRSHEIGKKHYTDSQICAQATGSISFGIELLKSIIKAVPRIVAGGMTPRCAPIYPKLADKWCFLMEFNLRRTNS
jgi:hypothetical protein